MKQSVDLSIQCYHSQVFTPPAVSRLYARLGGLGAVTVAIAVTGTGTSGNRLLTLLWKALCVTASH